MARQNFVGIVVSQGKMSKTIKVRVQQPTFNKRINKELLNRKDYLVHDEGDVCREGDLIRIEATRPISNRKSFAVAEILKNKGQQFAKFEADALANVTEEERTEALEFLARRDKLKQQEQEGSGLINDLVFINLIAGTPENKVSPEDLAKSEKLKEKYNITDWPPQSIVKLDTQELKEKLFAIQRDLAEHDRIEAEIKTILADENLTNEVLNKLGKQPGDVKKNIRKNLVRKYVTEASLAEAV